MLICIVSQRWFINQVSRHLWNFIKWPPTNIWCSSLNSPKSSSVWSLKILYLIVIFKKEILNSLTYNQNNVLICVIFDQIVFSLFTSFFCSVSCYLHPLVHLFPDSVKAVFFFSLTRPKPTVMDFKLITCLILNCSSLIQDFLKSLVTYYLKTSNPHLILDIRLFRNWICCTKAKL